MVWCEVNMDGLGPFLSMRDLRMQWSRAFSLVCEVALSVLNVIWDQLATNLQGVQF
jgi:hypothetical protein